MNKAFIDNSIGLLERIDACPEWKRWCEQYSVYGSNAELSALREQIDTFIQGAYEEGMVIQNYLGILEENGIGPKEIDEADALWLPTLSQECLLAVIAWHFCRDRFCEGALIAHSIASGKMLRMLRRLKIAQSE